MIKNRIENPFFFYHMSWIEHFFPSIFPVKVPYHFWKFSRKDFICCLIQTSSILVFWIIWTIKEHHHSILSYWDSPNYIYCSITLYNIPPDNPWTSFFQSPRSYFSCHFPGFPLIIRIFSLITFRNFQLSTKLSILLINFFISYFFRRFLILYQCSSKPMLSTILFSFVPIRLFIYKLTGASEPLYFLCVLMSFIFYKIDFFIPMWFSISLAIITRIEGLALWGTIGLCYLLRKNFKGAFITGTTFLSFCLVFLMHYFRFGKITGYFDYNQGFQSIVHHPFYMIKELSCRRSIEEIVPELFLYFILILGTLRTVFISVPFAIFSFVYFLYIISIFHLDTFRYALPGYIIVLFVGFNDVFCKDEFKYVLMILGPFFLFFEYIFAFYQFKSNLATDSFFKAVLNQTIVNIWTPQYKWPVIKRPNETDLYML